MATLKDINRLTSQIPGFPDLKIDPFVIPEIPTVVTNRFPEMREWEREFNLRFTEWQNRLQNSIREAMQAQKAQE